LLPTPVWKKIIMANILVKQNTMICVRQPVS